jgi:hypothetical protein
MIGQRPAQRARLIGLLLAFAAALWGCATSPPEPSGTPTRSATAADPGSCPVTLPGRGPDDISPDRFFGWGSSYGNDALWVGGLWPDGILAAGPEFVEDDGSIGMKFGWWRRVDGALEITGRRLDRPGPAVRGEVPDSYGPSGFTPSGVLFPGEGCWEVTGRVGEASLTFVTFVVRM